MAAVRPLIGITLGDPAGIGPELVLQSLNAPALRTLARFAIYGNAALLRRVAQAAHQPWAADLQVVPVTSSQTLLPRAKVPLLLDFANDEVAAIKPGQAHAACGRMAATWIEAAARDALAGRIDAVVTAPLNKEALHLAGVPYPGHTEMLAALSKSSHTTMLFWSPDLIVGLATIHLPIKKVPAALTQEKVLDAIRSTAATARRFGRAGKSIAVLALNPHAGEHELFGHEEETVIKPAMAVARAEGINVVGPLVPDVAFQETQRRQYAAYVAMYHDQGLIPFKMLAFAEGVNITLGLPFVRTSPDHGTAFDIAWKGKASPSSLFAAIRCAALLVAGKPD
jgi:4-hydroxythreonine-4-phosphate dehydrogenase